MLWHEVEGGGCDVGDEGRGRGGREKRKEKMCMDVDVNVGVFSFLAIHHGDLEM